jgi:hypothetical protein
VLGAELIEQGGRALGLDLAVLDEAGGEAFDLVALGADAIERACSDMWPRWMPSVAIARRAARLEARPAAAITWPSSAPERQPRISSASRATGCTRVAPPTTPTAAGRLIEPSSQPSSPRRQIASGR